MRPIPERSEDGFLFLGEEGEVAQAKAKVERRSEKPEVEDSISSFTAKKMKQAWRNWQPQ
jgi:hypothetical protein